MGVELRVRIWHNCCPYSGLSWQEMELHVESIANEIEDTRRRRWARDCPNARICDCSTYCEEGWA